MSVETPDQTREGLQSLEISKGRTQNEERRSPPGCRPHRHEGFAAHEAHSHDDAPQQQHRPKNQAHCPEPKQRLCVEIARVADVEVASALPAIDALRAAVLHSVRFCSARCSEAGENKAKNSERQRIHPPRSAAGAAETTQRNSCHNSAHLKEQTREGNGAFLHDSPRACSRQKRGISPKTIHALAMTQSVTRSAKWIGARQAVQSFKSQNRPNRAFHAKSAETRQ